MQPMTLGQLGRSLQPGGRLHARVMATARQVRDGRGAEMFGFTKGAWPRGTGNSREGWLPWSHAPDRRVVRTLAGGTRLGTPKPSTTQEIEAARTIFRRASSRDAIGFSHNGAEARVIARGLYPNPPEEGSYFPGEGHRVLTSGGFPTQSPSGVPEIIVAGVVARSIAKRRIWRLVRVA